MDIVKEALKRGKRLHIVHFDWFEFSTVKEKRQPERDYSMRIFLAKQNAARRELARIEKGKRDGEKFVNTSMRPRIGFADSTSNMRQYRSLPYLH